MKKKIFSFTLAEVLMVIAIIGVAAMLVVPKVNDDLDDREAVASLRKDSQEVSTALVGMFADKGYPYEWGVSGEALVNAATTNLGEFLETKKSCGKDAGCFSSNSTINTNNNYAKFILNDGAFLAISLLSNADENPDYKFCSKRLGYAKIDINGIKGPNEEKYDIFGFYICGEGLIGEGKDSDDGVVLYESNSEWVIQAGNRDYLKCNDLSWDTKRTCK